MLARIRDIFEPIEDHSQTRLDPPVDPWRESEERITVSGPGETSIIEVRYPAPAANDDDFLAFMVLDSLLTGPSTLDLFGGGISNKTSRLYQALVEKRIAVTVSGGVAATIDPYFYQIVLSMPPRKKHRKALSVLDRELDKFISRLPAAEELALAVRQARALFAYGSDSITTQAAWLGYAEMFDSYAWFESYLERLEAVTPADVQRVAEKYLRPAHRVIGIYQANRKGGAI
jgi:zinc protease